MNVNHKRTIYNSTLDVYKAVLNSFMDLLNQIVQTIESNNVEGGKRDLYIKKFETISKEVFEFVKIYFATLSVKKIAKRMNGEKVAELEFGGLDSATDFLSYDKFHRYVNGTIVTEQGAELTVHYQFRFPQGHPAVVSFALNLLNVNNLQTGVNSLPSLELKWPAINEKELEKKFYVNNLLSKNKRRMQELESSVISEVRITELSFLMDVKNARGLKNNKCPLCHELLIFNQELCKSTLSLAFHSYCAKSLWLAKRLWLESEENSTVYNFHLSSLNRLLNRSDQIPTLPERESLLRKLDAMCIKMY